MKTKLSGQPIATDDVNQKTIIGRIETVEFVDWPIPPKRAKVDTGARTSALDVENIEEVDDGHLAFDVVLDRKRTKRVRVTAPTTRRSRVRSSTGHRSHRHFVTANVRIGGVEKEIELSLIERPRMLFRMLLGRRALAPEFLVDVTRRTPRNKVTSK